MGLCVNELMKTCIVQMIVDADDLTASSLDFFNPYQNVRSHSTPRIRESQDVF